LPAPPALPFVFTIAGADDAHVWLPLKDGILVSDDNGDTWATTRVSADVRVTSLFAFDDATHWGTTEEGPVLATATGRR
jgi:hypothetical protein